MPNALPLLLIGGAAVVMLGGKKRSKGAGQRDIPLDKPIQVKKDGLTINSGRSPVPPAVKEAPLEPFDSIDQVQESLIASGKKIKADGKWGKKSQGALDEFQAEEGFVNEAKAHLATPDSLRALHAEGHKGTKQGVMADPRKSPGSRLWCNYVTLAGCPADHECVPLFGPGDAPAGWEDVGICFARSMLEAGYIPTPQDYAPGGFNEVVFSPDYSAVDIGGGWGLQTLDAWLYDRMKDGKLLTYALEGSLFWEDTIVKSPKDFWNATLASAGLATAAAGVGTKGWLSYQSAFRKELPIDAIRKKSTQKAIQVWKGPEGFVPAGIEAEPFGRSWPPPEDVSRQYAEFVPEKIPTSRTGGRPTVIMHEPIYGPNFGVTQAVYEGGRKIHPGHPEFKIIQELDPSDQRVARSHVPDGTGPGLRRPGRKPYIINGGPIPFTGGMEYSAFDSAAGDFAGEVSSRGKPMSTLPFPREMTAGKADDMLRTGASGYGFPTDAADRIFYAESMEEAIELAERGIRGAATSKPGLSSAKTLIDQTLVPKEHMRAARANRMMELFTDRTMITEVATTVGETGKTAIKWAKPKLGQIAKGIGIPMAVGAVIAGTAYGTTQLARALGDKQRALVAESAALAWKDFARTHKVRVGNSRVRIDKLPEVIAVQFFQAYVVKKIVRFQMSTYE